VLVELAALATEATQSLQLSLPLVVVVAVRLSAEAGKAQLAEVQVVVVGLLVQDQE
jgi:hypothetical protein